ncbi:MFS transporter [Mycobacterium sp. M1]|uniref:MFS transporter n=1 Tax=Mycolicibacter acidiphilus TaxID=2835306 RepID=A0ABS5RK50_9MYCO|nr:MFS transporter [Mycolicibacter acidiphilus]MBS9534658.1 MFS transporter [Mycolicibacter acidiphilus]
MHTEMDLVAARAAALPSARRRFMGAGAMGFLAFGVWAPLALVFYTVYRGFSVAGTGAALTVGAGAAAVLSIRPAGVLSDRIGPLRAQSLGAVLQAIGAALTAAPVHSLALPAVVAFIGGAGNNIFFTADTEGIRRVSADTEQCDRMFAQMASARLVSFGLGAGFGGLVLMFERRHPWLWVAGVESCAVVLIAVAVVFWTLRHVDDTWIPYGDTEKCDDDPPSYASVLAETPFMVFVFGQFGVALVTMGLDSVLALYVLAVGLPRWSVPLSTAVACAVAAAVPLVVHRLAKRFGSVPMLMVAALAGAAAFVGYYLSGAVGLTAGVVVLTVASGLFGAADGTGAALGTAVALSFAPRHLSGRHASIHSASWSVGGVLAPMAYTTLFAGHASAPWLFSAGLMLLTFTAYAWVRRLVV